MKKIGARLVIAALAALALAWVACGQQESPAAQKMEEAAEAAQGAAEQAGEAAGAAAEAAQAAGAGGSRCRLRGRGSGRRCCRRCRRRGRGGRGRRGRRRRGGRGRSHRVSRTGSSRGRRALTRARRPGAPRRLASPSATWTCAATASPTTAAQVQVDHDQHRREERLRPVDDRAHRGRGTLAQLLQHHGPAARLRDPRPRASRWS